MRFKQKRTALALVVLFGVIGSAYFVLSHDAGGTTTLLALAIAMGLAAFALVVGTPDDA